MTVKVTNSFLQGKNMAGREKTERNARVKSAKKSGKSYRDIGKQYDISGKRVFEIVKDKSLAEKKPKAKPKAKKPKKKSKR